MRSLECVWLFSLIACGPSEPAGGADPPVGSKPLRFALPLAEPDRFRDVIGVDHDPAVYTERIDQVRCWDYLERRFPHCYDEHDGTDFLLVDGFEAMDAGSSPVVAAADGVVVETEDGHYDRCHGTLEGVDCDGYDGVANRVIVEHVDGVRTLYWHLQSGSVAVAVGDDVSRGTLLGKVGSSGYSSMPHLHFEVQHADGASLDPYSGPASQPTSWWCQQEAASGLPSDRCDAS